MASFFHINFCQSRKNGFWWKWRWRKTGMIIKKDHQPAVLMFVLFSTKRQCACYQISHSAPISRATISSSRLVKAISNWVGYQSHVQHVLEISCLEMHVPCSNQIYLVTLHWYKLYFTKDQMLQNAFLISVMLRWHSGVENNEIWTFRVNFLCQKPSKYF